MATKVSYEGIGRLLNSPEMVAAMEKIANKIKDRAEATAPVYEKGKHPGRYKASFRVEAKPNGGFKGNRAEAKVINDAPEAFFVEFGSAHNKRHRTLGSAIDAARE